MACRCAVHNAVSRTHWCAEGVAGSGRHGDRPWRGGACGADPRGVREPRTGASDRLIQLDVGRV